MKRLEPFLQVVAVLPLSLIGACTSLGGNVKGSFSCAAPDGICAPSALIDDRALAMIAGDGGDIVAPTEPHVSAAKERGGSRSSARGGYPASLSINTDQAQRTREKVLRIIFMPHVDGYGHLHEASALLAVVGQSEWRSEALRTATPLPESLDEPATVLVDAPDAAPSRFERVGELPDPETVAAARARRSDPLAAIKADVSERLHRPPSGVREASSLARMPANTSTAGPVSNPVIPSDKPDASKGGTAAGSGPPDAILTGQGSGPRQTPIQSEPMKADAFPASVPESK